MTNSADLTTTIVSTVGGIIVALVGGRGAQVLVRRNQARKPVTAPIPVGLPADQQAFIATLMADNKDLRGRFDKIERTVNLMREEQENEHAREQTFSAALGRWLAKIYRGWPRDGAPFPMPDGDDMKVLSEIIPRG